MVGKIALNSNNEQSMAALYQQNLEYLEYPIVDYFSISNQQLHLYTVEIVFDISWQAFDDKNDRGTCRNRIYR